MALLVAGWRRFGHTLFRQTCSGSSACRSLRVDVARFQANRSQRRVKKANERDLVVRVDVPEVTPEKIELFDRFHGDRAERKGWQAHEPDDVEGYVRSFVLNPFPTEEWCYFLNDVLVGVGYVDRLSGGLSAIYFAHDPSFRDRSLGVWNVLVLLERAKGLGLPHLYLGYMTEACPSLCYKGRFRPNEQLGRDGLWRSLPD
jgi:arginine-tRNA-protein transferase